MCSFYLSQGCVTVRRDNKDQPVKIDMSSLMPIQVHRPSVVIGTNIETWKKGRKQEWKQGSKQASKEKRKETIKKGSNQGTKQ